MYFAKVQKDFLADMLRAAKGHDLPRFFATYDQEHNLMFVSDGQFFCIIPSEVCFISARNDKKRLQLDFFRKMYKADPDERNILEKTQLLGVIPGTKTQYRIFKTIDGEEIRVNEKLLQYFPDDNCIYYGTNRKSPVSVYMSHTFLGLILPINYK